MEDVPEEAGSYAESTQVEAAETAKDSLYAGSTHANVEETPAEETLENGLDYAGVSHPEAEETPEDNLDYAGSAYAALEEEPTEASLDYTTSGPPDPSEENPLPAFVPGTRIRGRRAQLGITGHRRRTATQEKRKSIGGTRHSRSPEVGKSSYCRPNYRRKTRNSASSPPPVMGPSTTIHRPRTLI